MSDIELRFVNQSNDANNSQVVIFQRNVAPSFEEIAVAWRLIHTYGMGDVHSFSFPLAMDVAAGDSFGNETPHLQAQAGQMFRVTSSPSGAQLVASGNANSPTEVQVLNGLQQGAINASIYRDGKLLAMKTNIAPQQRAIFQFKPTIWVGVVSQVEEGDVMSSAILSTINTELSLLGVASADIVMTGGGPGATSTPFTFTLQNVVTA